MGNAGASGSDGGAARPGRIGRLLALAVALAALTAVLALATAVAAMVTAHRAAAPLASGEGGQGAPGGGAGGAGSGGAAASELGGDGADTRRIRAPGAREIVLDFDSGRLELIAATSAAAGATVERRWSGPPPTLLHRFEGGVLRVTSRCPEPRDPGDQCRIHGRVGVPAGARVRAELDAGSITATDLDSPSFEARSGAGNLTASFLRPPDSVDATTDAGILSLAVPPGSYAVDAGTGVGPASVEIPSDPAAPRRIVAHAAVGQVRVSTR
jgi:hypothetical protein